MLLNRLDPDAFAAEVVAVAAAQLHRIAEVCGFPLGQRAANWPETSPLYVAMRRLCVFAQTGEGLRPGELEDVREMARPFETQAKSLVEDAAWARDMIYFGEEAIPQRWLLLLASVEPTGEAMSEVIGPPVESMGGNVDPVAARAWARARGVPGL